ncbi:MAG: FtsH protease activity modulator HflK [Clostridiaceae bacterium]|nr:FtsH protease activity modulator HflK [Clostridiaceae bacterium]
MDNRNNEAQEAVRRAMPLVRRFLPIALVVVLVIIGLTGIYKVDSGQAIVITRFGHVIRVEEQAGINFKIPLIESAHTVSLEQRYKIEYGFRTVSDSSYSDVEEEQTVIVEAVGNNSSLVLTELTVEYQVENPVDYLFSVEDPERAIRLILEDALRNVMQSVTLDEALTDKATIDSLIRPEIQSKLNAYESGIRIIEVKTQNTSLLPAVDTAYREIERANQHRNSRIEEAQKYSNTVVPQAEADAFQLVEESKGYKASILADARAEVAQFKALLTEYQRNPELVMEKMYTESMRLFLENNRIVIATTGDGSFYKFYNINDTQDAAKAGTAVGEGGVTGG